MQNILKKGHFGILFTLLLTFVFVGCDKEEATIIHNRLPKDAQSIIVILI